MLQKLKNILMKYRFLLAAFLIPFGIASVVCIGQEFFPFGQNQIAVIDMYHQYVPFLSELQNKLQNGGSFLYSWNGGAGTNFISLMAYYTASPLNLLLKFIPETWLMEGITFIVLLKMGFAGIFMAIYLKHMYKREDWSTVAFSTLYALCAYVVGYYWCLMWLDGVALLPLCILGLNRLLDKGDFKLYIITLALMLYTNYYIGGMMCIFIFFYYPALYFSKRRNLGAKGCALVTGKAVLCSFTAIFISAFLLLPTYLSLKNTYYIDSQMPEDIVFYRPILDIVNNLLPQMEVTVRTGGPNLYCGIFTVMMFVFFLTCSRITVRKKLANCIILGFLVLSLNVNKLDFIWHGFHFPNMIPFRWSFAISFILVGLAYEAFIHFRTIKPRQIAYMAGIGAAYVIFIQKISFEDLKPEFAYVTLILLFMYSGFLALYRRGGFDRNLMKILLLTIVIFEMVISTTSAIQTVNYTSRVEYFAECSEVKELVRKTQEKDDGFYRMEIDSGLTLNSPMLYNYPGVSQFSSTVTADVSDFMEDIGLDGRGSKNRYNYYINNPVTNAMLGIKYIIGRGNPIMNETSLELIDGVEMTSIYKNKYELSMGYMVNAPALYSWNRDSGNPFENLNQFVKVATGIQEDVFYRIGDPKVEADGVEVGPDQNGYLECTYTGEVKAPKVELEYTVPETQQVYVCVDADQGEALSARRSDGTLQYISVDCDSIRSVGLLNAGESVTVTADFKKKSAGAVTSYVYALDQKVWEAAYAKLCDEQLRVTEHDDTHVKGTITANTRGICVISIPYEKGWDVKVDGRKANVELFGDAFIAVPMEEGTHDIELTYRPEGLAAGILISVLGLLIFAVLCVLERRRR